MFAQKKAGALIDLKVRMKPPGRLTLLLLLSFVASSAWGESPDEARLQGFAQHHKAKDRFEQARQQGERAYLEEEDQWERQKDRQLEEYKKNKKSIVMTEDGPEAQADAAAKKRWDESYEKERRVYAAESARRESLDREAKKLPTESQELGLLEDRPRYDYRKRAMFGGKPKFGSSASSGSSGGSSFGGGSSSPSFPPPPTFDDFGGDGGYVPAPNMPEDYGDIPPPPPPPPPPFGDDFGGGFGGDSDFPPPPPPPPFEGGGDF